MDRKTNYEIFRSILRDVDGTTVDPGALAAEVGVAVAETTDLEIRPMERETRDAGPPAPPTEAELEVLQALWARGEATVPQLHEDLEARREVGYTTVLKLLQIMHGKGLVIRRRQGRGHVYSASEAREATQGRLLDRLADRAFGGSTARLVMRALGDRRASEAELDEIRSILDRAQAERDAAGETPAGEEDW